MCIALAPLPTLMLATNELSKTVRLNGAAYSRQSYREWHRMQPQLSREREWSQTGLYNSAAWRDAPDVNRH